MREWCVPLAKYSTRKRGEDLYNILTSNEFKGTIATAQKIRRKKDIVVNMIISELEDCIGFTEKQCVLAYRRVILDEKIPHDEMVLSYPIFLICPRTLSFNSIFCNFWQPNLFYQGVTLLF